MNLKIVVIAGLFLVVLAGVLVLALSEGTIEYRTFPEMQSEAYEGERVKVKAQVVEILNDFKPTEFVAVDIAPEDGAGRSLGSARVIYHGDDVPQGFKKSAHVTLEGRYNKEKRVFEATIIQTQCPSRYEGEGPPPPPGSEGNAVGEKPAP